MTEDEQLTLRRWRMQDEQEWQRISMPLAMMMEFRQVITTTIYLEGDTTGKLSQLLQQVGSLEGRLLREAWKRYRLRTQQMLILDQRRSWRETCQLISEEGNYRLASEIAGMLPAIKKLVADNFVENTEE